MLTLKYSEIQLSHNELKALKYLRIPISHFERVNVSTNVISDRLSVNTDQGKYIIDNLLNYGLIEIDPLSKIGQSSVITYRMTSKGKEYLTVLKNTLISKITWSLLIPIIVSVITSLITTYLTN